MTLPINISTLYWVVPKAVWEWEVEPATPGPSSEGDAAGASSNCDPAREAMSLPPITEPTRRLVFKGYTQEIRYSFVFADGLAARPWNYSIVEDSQNRHHRQPQLDPAGDRADLPKDVE